MADPELVHVVFPLEVDEEGWPPVGSERLWAQRIGDVIYRVDNTPWFVRNLAAGDVVRAVPLDDGSWPTFVEKIQWSGNYTIRVIPFRGGPLEGSLQAVQDLFTPHGADGEGAGQYGIVALNVPPTADVAAVHALLFQGQAEGWWDIEEGCVDDAWLSLPI